MPFLLKAEKVRNVSGLVVNLQPNSVKTKMYRNERNGEDIPDIT